MGGCGLWSANTASVEFLWQSSEIRGKEGARRNGLSLQGKMLKSVQQDASNWIAREEY